MKILLTALLSLTLTLSCKNRSSAETENLPKDVSLKPDQEKIPADSARATVTERDTDTIISSESIAGIKNKIESLINGVTCDDASKWRMSPFGAKPCGGPASYIAYPKELESQLLPLITEYNQKSALYNKQNGLTSDCSLVPPPASIICENGKAVLQRGLPPEGSAP